MHLSCHQPREGARAPSRLALILGFAVLLTTCSTQQRKSAPVPPDFSLPPPRTCPDPVAGPNQQLTEQVGESNLPQISWDGRTFTIAWWEMRSGSEIYTVRIDKNGTRRSRETALPNERSSKHHSIAWDGKETHIVWSDGGLVKSQRFGKVVAPPATLAPGGQAPQAGAWGSAVWVNRGRLFFRSDGIPEKIATKHEGINGIVLTAGGISDPTVVWTGDMYALAWSISQPSGRRIALQRVAPDGAALGPLVSMSKGDGVATQPKLAWSGQQFGLAWLRETQDATGITKHAAVFATLPKMATAATVVADLDLDDDVQGISIASSGKEFAIAWVAPTENRNSLIYMQRISNDGILLEPRLTISDGRAFYSSQPHIVWADDGYAIVWHDDRAATGNEIFFSFVQCGDKPPPAPPVAESEPIDTGDTDSEADTESDSESDSANPQAAETPPEPPAELKPVFESK